MPEMKNSGINYIGSIPENWQCGKIKHIVSTPVVTGAGEEAQDKTLNSIRYIRISDFDKNGNVIEDNAAYIPQIKGEKYILPNGVILAATAGGTVGKTLLFEGLSEPACYAGYLAKIETNPDKMLNKFLLYQMRCQIMDGFRVYSVKKSTIENISASAYSNMPIVIPPLNIQKSIANFLDQKCSEIDSLSADIQTQIDVLNEYKKSVIIEAVTKGLNPEVEMKNSGIEWIGMIPAHWDIHPVYHYFGERKVKNSALKEQNLLSLSYGKIVRKDIESLGGLLPASFNTYNIVEAGDIIIRPTDLQNDKRSLRTGLVTEHGIITSAYIDLMPKADVNSKYFHYLLHSYDVMKVFYNMGNGVRQGLNYSEFAKLMIFAPSAQEQQEIVSYLDSKCAEIDTVITDKKAQLETLTEYKKSLIYEYVTGKKEVPENV